MRFCLINPPWSFYSSIYFGCREPHLPLEYGYSKLLLERAGHEVEIVDAQLDGFDMAELRARVRAFRPDYSVVTTAPSYLFWRCAPPELRVPAETLDAIRDIGGMLVAVGPHASTTPRATLRKLKCDAVVLGECEEILPRLAGDWNAVDSICYHRGGEIQVKGSPHAANMTMLPALHWPADAIHRHAHHHHRFDAPPEGPGAEMETSRGCPYHCTFCAKDNFRNSFRRRPLATIADELDGLVAQGVEYVYFIDEIFLPYTDVLVLIRARGIRFGIQTRIDLWNPKSIALLGSAGCVSIEAGVESITEAGRARLDKKCKLSTAQITQRLIQARETEGIPFVQANLLNSSDDDPADVERWRAELQRHGIWANKPVPLFPYPGSPDYTRRWGIPDDRAWERAHEFYLGQFDEFSDIQEQRPLPLVQLELSGGGRA
ncbi:MAG TPA: TIGR04295 family B12-binding domain-containing radical SAM protein [Bryobacteraceae bacterium]|jgi:B12-binding domain/radical SAM domain protein of rhizo-twelve system|nr:TIGR04295 family B12-binding domain-containing radical SAM protein [Bryobacteraceae bacterium]